MLDNVICHSYMLTTATLEVGLTSTSVGNAGTTQSRASGSLTPGIF